VPTIKAKTIRDALIAQREGKKFEVIDTHCPGLTMRVRPRGVRWSVRVRLHGRQRRWDLGLVVEGDDNVDGVCLASARAWATTVREYARKDQNPEPFIERVTGRSAAPVATGPRPDRMTLLWQDAVEQYLDSLYDPKKPEEATNRPATRKDYKSKLAVPELLIFGGRALSTITREEIAEANAKTCKRAYDMGCGSLRTLKAFWSWLRDPMRSRITGVSVSIADLRAPPPARKDAGTPGMVFDAAREARGKAPPEIVLGRVLAIARAGVLPERISLGVQLLLSSVQRRRQVVGASGRRIITYDETPSERAWFVPPYFRKTRKGGSRSHLVPVLGFGATAVDALAKLADEDGREWLFPTREAVFDKPADEGVLNKWFSAMPGVECSTHGGRYAFSTYGPRDMGFARSEAKIILDHFEGVEPNDVTGRFYSADPAIGRKREMMERWIAWLEHWCAEAIRKDGLLTDSEALSEKIFKSRYGDERWAKKHNQTIRGGECP
jgi:hypothetical protein